MRNLTKRLENLERAVSKPEDDPDFIRSIEIMNGDEVMVRMDWNPELRRYVTTYEQKFDETD